MRVSGIGLASRTAACTILLALLPGASAAFPVHVQDARLAADDSGDVPVEALPAAHVADSERAFDQLDAEAGLRAGGPFSFDYQHLVFFPGDAARADEGDVDLWIAASVQADRVRGVFDGGWKYGLEMQVELWQADTLAFSRDARTELVLGSPLVPAQVVGQGFPVQTDVRLPAGVYDYRLRIRDVGWGEAERAVNEVSGRIEVPRPVRTQPFVSSIAVAADTGGTWEPAPGLSLKLNAARIVYDDARPFVYFEAYGLTPGADYRGEVRLVSRRVTRGADDVFGGAYQPYQLQYRGAVPGDPAQPVRKVLRLDLAQTRPGPYELQVRVRDLATGEASEVRTARLKVQESKKIRPLQPGIGGGNPTSVPFTDGEEE